MNASGIKSAGAEFNNMNNKFVSRAGKKLEFALSNWQIDIHDKICADLGCSTGGFTDCLLDKGAKKVYAVDTAYGVLDWKLRNDKRVAVMERTNALNLNLPEKMDFICIDVGWTPQARIMPKALSLLKKDGNIISLLKPHYEADKSWLTRGKLDEKYYDKVLVKVKSDLIKANANLIDLVASPIIGAKGGNKEFLMWIKNVD